MAKPAEQKGPMLEIFYAIWKNFMLFENRCKILLPVTFIDIARWKKTVSLLLAAGF